MKDALLLLATGAGVALTSWAFFHIFGADAWDVLSSVILVGLLIDNFRLRRLLRAMHEGD